MAQIINSSDEVLDGAQIANKLVSALKPGQTAFASDDLRCYDLGQIKAKYNIGVTQSYSTAPDNRLPAHLGYFPLATFKYGSTPKAAYENTSYSTYYFLDPSFNGTAQSVVGIGSVLYSEYRAAGDNVPAPAGYYMRPDNYYWRITESGGVIASGNVYTPAILESTFPYCYTYGTPGEDLDSIRQYLNGQSYANGWGLALGTIYQNLADHKWYDYYDPDNGSWGNLVTGIYVKEGDTNGLDFFFKRITSGGVYEQGQRYKRTTFNLGTYQNTAVYTGTTITITITSYIKWQVALTGGSGYATLGGTTYGEGNGSFTITIAANSTYSSRNISFSVTDRLGLITTPLTGSITQEAAPVPSTPVPYYGFLDIAYVTYNLAEDKNNCYYSGQSGTIYYNSNNYTYYQDANLTYIALPGYYMITQGMDGYPNFADSEFILLNY